MVEERLINSSLTDEDLNDSDTRPSRLSEFVGQRCNKMHESMR